MRFLGFSNVVATFILATLIIFGSLWADEIVFVQPKLIDSSMPSTPSNIHKGEVDGQKVLLFDIIPTDGALQELHSKFLESQMILKVFELRRLARTLRNSSECGSICVDPASDPFIVYVGDGMGYGGPAVASNIRILASDHKRKIRSDSLLILAPLKIKGSIMRLTDFHQQRYFAPLIAHEFFHGLMGDLYGSRMIEMKARSYSRNGHAAHKVTDPFLAFIEGTAEAMELVALEEFPEEVADRLVENSKLSDSMRAFIKGFKKNRLVLARHNKLGFISDGRILDGKLDSAEDILSTEGVIASLTHRLFFKDGFQSSMVLMLQTLARHRPLHFIDFVKAFLKDHPESRPTLLRQFLETTRYVTVHKDAVAIYRDYYLTGKAWKQKKVPLEVKQASTERWKSFKEDLFERVLGSKLQIDDNLIRSYVVSDENFFYNLDLNKADRDEIYEFFDEFFSDKFSEIQLNVMLDMLFKLRDQGHSIRDMQSLEWPEYVESRLQEMHSNFMDHQEKQIAEKMSSLTEGLYKFQQFSSDQGAFDAFISCTDSVFHLQNEHLR